MDLSMQVLVIIVSATLIIFLVFSIITLIKIIQLLNEIKRIIDKFERITEQAETIGEIIKKSAVPIALGRFISNIAEAIFNKRSSGDQKKHKRKRGE